MPGVRRTLDESRRGSTKVNVHEEADLLRKVPMFEKLEPSRLKLLAFTSHAVTFPDGHILFREGDPSDSAYVIMSGVVEILSHTERGDAVVATLEQNDLLGELAVITNCPRLSTLRARGEVVALELPGDLFLQLIAENPEVALHVMRQLSGKLASLHRRYTELQARLGAG